MSAVDRTSEQRGGWWRRLMCRFGRHDTHGQKVLLYAEKAEFRCFWCGSVMNSFELEDYR